MSNLSIVFRIVRRRNIAKRWESSYAGHIIQKKKKTLKLWIFWIRNRKNQRKKKRKRGKKKEKNVELNIASVSIKKKKMEEYVDRPVVIFLIPQPNVSC